MVPRFQADNVTLYQGDALAILTTLKSGSVDAVLTDPPYSSGGVSLSTRQADPAQKYQLSGVKRRYPPMLGDAKDQHSWAMWCTLWLGECWRIARDGVPLMVFTDWTSGLKRRRTSRRVEMAGHRALGQAKRSPANGPFPATVRICPICLQGTYHRACSLMSSGRVLLSGSCCTKGSPDQQTRAPDRKSACRGRCTGYCTRSVHGRRKRGGGLYQDWPGLYRHGTVAGILRDQPQQADSRAR